MTIAVLGSVALDVLAREDGAVGTVGNSGANIAIRLAGHGQQVQFFCALGDDPAGRIVRGQLERAGVDTSGLVQRAGFRTPIVFQSPSPDGSPVISISCPRCGAPGMRPALPALDELSHTARAGLGAAAAVVTDLPSLLAMHADTGALLWLEAGAPYADRAQARDVARRATIVKWSADETDGAVDAQTARPSAWLLTTHGAAGVDMRASGAPSTRIPAAPVAQLVDTMGAGDAFTAAAVASLHRDGRTDAVTVEAAARAGVVAAARACEHFGARGDMASTEAHPVRIGCGLCEDDA